MTVAEPIAVTVEFAHGLDQLGLDYAVGGSIASSLHGVPRSTQDIDVLVVLPGARVDPFVEYFSPSFYVDRDMIVDAIRRRASFNVIHLATMYKVDVFVADRSQMIREELRRRRVVTIGEPPRDVWVCSPEDIILQKLVWYREGQEISERQWSDVQGVLKVQADRLDREYIRKWASELGISELTQRALSDVASPEGDD
ncbi:MAG: hypothetical protein AB7K71_00935 [Polyangiaceae bacterium]